MDPRRGPIGLDSRRLVASSQRPISTYREVGTPFARNPGELQLLHSSTLLCRDEFVSGDCAVFCFNRCMFVVWAAVHSGILVVYRQHVVFAVMLC